MPVRQYIGTGKFPPSLRQIYEITPNNLLHITSFSKKHSFFLLFIKTFVHLQSQFDGEFIDIEIWCNGSTTDSGSVSEGSSPSIST